jgi:rifampicin phosphotransferase
MASEAKRLDDYDLKLLSDHELASEIDKRQAIYQYWHDIYWDEFIPFAHGVRLFGEFYNDNQFTCQFTWPKYWPMGVR